MNSTVQTALFLLLLGIGACSLTYIIHSRGNPRFIELTVGTVALGLAIGVISSMVVASFQNSSQLRLSQFPSFQIESIPFIVAALSAITFFVATLIYSSNQPQDISHKIGVTYLLNVDTKEPPETLRPNNSTAHIFYRDVIGIFRKFRTRSDENTARIDQLLAQPGWNPNLTIFRDFTEYLVPYFVGSTFVSPEAEPHFYSHTVSKLLGKPVLDIAGTPKRLSEISELLQANPFFGIHGARSAEPQIRLPRHTESILERPDDWLSVLVLKNRFVKITIGIQLLVTKSNGYAFLDPTALPSPDFFWPSPFAESIIREQKATYRSYETMIHLDAVFNKYSYGFPERKYHEEWTKDLFSFLERSFAWGHPMLREP